MLKLPVEELLCVTMAASRLCRRDDRGGVGEEGGASMGSTPNVSIRLNAKCLRKANRKSFPQHDFLVYGGS